MNSALGFAIILNILFLTSIFSKSLFQKCWKCYLLILAALPESILSKSIFAKNLGRPQTSVVIYSNSSFLISGLPVNILSINSSVDLTCSGSRGLPSEK
jgi:hypothetical protein